MAFKSPRKENANHAFNELEVRAQHHQFRIPAAVYRDWQLLLGYSTQQLSWSADIPDGLL